ncbi:Hsp20/alpha crystallin family protein [Thermodesulfobacterium sp. TA1]|uniref:Hsp20/alpha crystallin family protein n=1 Tax=Thermodesulfobacterium sp. TA1 TaxID=2234087 RepID=UPI0012322924|nr:Hsp20/alpha crystallin family protein [Thermodesulfobacterium sp. TA1]QER41970.1 Hsp20/alpha crystallin family protein [Thermodesulfobacterium sp. TA1]
MADIILWRPLQELKKEMDRIWQDFFGKEVIPERWEGISWVPAVDISETEDNVIVKVDVPGVNPEDMEISIVDNVLLIKGEKKKEEEEKKENFYRVERFYGSFMRSIPIPCEVDVEKIEATYKDGVLKIVLPKKPEEKKKVIKINVEK